MEFVKFVDRLPTDQAALDIFAGGWASAMPTRAPLLVAGAAALFDADSRPGLAATAFGKRGRLDGMSICELGPLEGGHTYQLEHLGASVTAIEGNAEAYLKCLIVKEVFDMKSKFMLGNFLTHLDENQQSYDLVFASGVLYHMSDPLRLIELICRRSKRCFVWSHYYDTELCTGWLEKPPAAGAWGLRSYQQHYGDRNVGGFWGGLDESRSWMRREDIIAAFRHFGHERVDVVEEDRTHPHGPCFSIVTQEA